MLTKISNQSLSIEQFEAQLINVCGAFSLSPKAQNAVVNGVVKHEHLADLEVVHVAKDLNSIKRTQREISKDDSENFFLIIQEEGQALMSQADSARILIPGDMMLIDSALASEFSFFGRSSRQLSVHLSREEMLQRFGGLATGGKFISREDHCSLAVAAILSKAFRVRDNQAQSRYLKEAIFGLVGAMLYEQETPFAAKKIDADVGGAQIFERGMAYIDANFTDPSFTLQSVADYLKISMRHMQRAFSAVDQTPTEYLLNRRLERACQLLAGNHHECTNRISTIAYNAGFSDVSNFNKQFKRAMQCSPSQYQSLKRRTDEQ